jgi:hypothetical protein
LNEADGIFSAPTKQRRRWRTHCILRALPDGRRHFDARVQ